MTDWEYRLSQLPRLYLSQEVGLVFHRVGTRDEPLVTILIRLGLSIMTSGDKVVVVPHLLVEGTKLDEAVAHHIGVGGETSLHLVHRIASHLAPVLLVAIHHLEFAAILVSHSRSHLQILLGGAIPLLLLLRTYLDVEAVGMQAQSGELPHDHRTIDTARQQDGDALILDFSQKLLVSIL